MVCFAGRPLASANRQRMAKRLVVESHRYPELPRYHRVLATISTGSHPRSFLLTWIGEVDCTSQIIVFPLSVLKARTDQADYVLPSKTDIVQKDNLPVSRPVFQTERGVGTLKRLQHFIPTCREKVDPLGRSAVWPGWFGLVILRYDAMLNTEIVERFCKAIQICSGVVPGVGFVNRNKDVMPTDLQVSIRLENSEPATHDGRSAESID